MEINEAYEPYIKNAKRINVLFGGRGSAKSYSIAQKKIIRITSYPYVKDIIMRKNYISLKDSCYSLLGEVIRKEDLRNKFAFRVSPLEIIYLPTGSKFLFRGLNNEEDREKIKSIVNPTGAWMEEANEFDEADFTEVNLIVRGKSEAPKEIDVSFNPIDEELWLKRRFFDRNDENILTINTTYRDNKFLDREYIETLESLIDEDDNYYNVYVLGKWGQLDIRGKIYKKFIDANIVSYAYNPRLPIIVCCDFNVDPMKWALIQNVNGIDYVFDEIVKPDTDTETMVQELIKRYGTTNYEIYGDYSGTFRHTSSRTTDYQIIKQYLPAASINIKPNPPVVDRINAVNWRFCNKENKRRLLVDPKCVNVIYDAKHSKYKEGKREEDKAQEKYDGKNPVLSMIHIMSAVGYYIEYNYSLKGKIIGYQW